MKKKGEERKCGLQQELLALHGDLRSRYQHEYDRNLPFSDELFDRWERAKFLGFGEGTRVYDSSYIFGDVKIGRDCFIGQFTIIDGSGGLEIGDFCCISAGTHIMTHDSVDWCLSGGTVAMEHSPVKIGKNCYIGPQCVINRGVTIGDHSVIGAKSFVNRDIPPFSIAYGVPARVIGEITLRNDGTIQRIVRDKD
ncbi:MAG TPA: acyltransferase [Methanoregulaceae archaeon]|nr:acyltransferase [Methanoregulaceae archaeon]